MNFASGGDYSLLFVYNSKSRGHALLRRRRGLPGRFGVERLYTRGFGWDWSLLYNLEYDSTARSRTKRTLRSLWRVRFEM